MNYKNSPKYVCSECAGSNENIKEDIFAEEAESETCGYCKEQRSCIAIASLAEVVNQIYRDDYAVCESGSEPCDIIQELLELDHSAGKLDWDLVSLLSSEEAGSSQYKDEEPMYDMSQTYGTSRMCNPPLNDGSEHKELWDSVCDQIKHRTRFFNNTVIKSLDGIFNDLDKLSYKGEKRPVRDIQPGDSEGFYRARLAKDAEERIKFCCHPAQELAAPPAHLAKNGRMNPVGVSVLYAAFEEETCIAELRLPVGETTISGKFSLEQAITVLDLTVFETVDLQATLREMPEQEGYEQYDSYEDRIAFLHKFSAEISKPISPDKETLEYMPTQALIEYLAYHHEPKIDAVIYASTQVGGKAKNIVFLNRTAKLINGTEPKNGQYNARWGKNSYDIELKKERTIKAAHIGQGGRVFQASDFSRLWDESANITFVTNEDYVEDEYLSFVRGSLRVHKIKAVEYKTERFNVNIVNK